MLLSNRFFNLVFLGFALLLLPEDGNCLTIERASLGSGSQSGLLLAELDNGQVGSVCMLNDSRVGTAVCTYLLGKANSSAVRVTFFKGTAPAVVVALNGCHGYDPSQTGRWNLNNDCDVKTGPAIPGICNERRLQLACELVELRPDSASSEGLVVVGLTGQLGTVCATGAGLNEAAAVCRSLGFANPESAYPITGRYKPNPSDPTENTTVEQLNCKPGDRLINCNWQSASGCYEVHNRLAVACNPVAPTPKPMPSPTLVCYRQEARICFGTNAISSMSELQLMYNATEVSGCVVISEVTPAQVCAKVQSYSTCAAVSGETAQYTQYHLLMRFLGEKNSIGNYVRPPMSFDLYCRLAKETLATGQSIGPDFVTPTSAIDGHSGGVSVVEIYRGLTGGNFTDGPISGSVEVGTILYAAVVLRGAANLTSSWLVVNSCWATDGQQNATLVENKCPRDGSVILIPVNNTAMAVRFQAFMFNTSSGGIGSGSMQLLCSTIVCRLGDPSEQCSRQCVSFYYHEAALGTQAEQEAREMVTLPASLSVHQPANSGRRLSLQFGVTAVATAAGLSLLWML
ncbi:hypothetical protein BOX15_Mlig015418g1 [Macrostomum lignano]|uniref:SRCR domain-containing protein n=1 Tax=Macrostomum lignano TaxID=282301 RepID=A0A267DPZ8_9PLAT|nr:hypothetical protein BOX15_Mlig015418g1 [Macrostomum lignano]